MAAGLRSPRYLSLFQLCSVCGHCVLGEAPRYAIRFGEAAGASRAVARDGSLKLCPRRGALAPPGKYVCLL